MLVSDPLSRGWNLFGTAEVAAMNVSFINYPAVIASPKPVPSSAGISSA